MRTYKTFYVFFSQIHNDSPALIFADELKQVIERYMFGICPQSYKVNDFCFVFR